MTKPSAPRVAAYRTRKDQAGQRRREMYLTDDEWERVQQTVKQIRSQQMNVYKTAEEAIKASIQQTEIARCERTEANLDYLMSECDDRVEGNEDEFWGEDDNGNQWRVHVA